MACRIASPLAPVTSRWAVLPRRYVTGKASFGVNQRKAASGIATPRTTAQTMSEGWSTAEVEPGEGDRRRSPRRSRASPSSRGRPAPPASTRCPIRHAARIAIGNDGIEKPIQSPMIVTPYGRGRWRAVDQRCRGAPATSRLDQERQQVPPPLEDDQRTRTSPPPRMVIDQAVPTAPSGAHRRGEPVGPQRGDRAEDRGLERGDQRLLPQAKATSATARSAARPSQSLPLVPSFLGSGGGAPVGRRRRPPIRAVPGTASLVDRAPEALTAASGGRPPRRRGGGFARADRAHARASSRPLQRFSGDRITDDPPRLRALGRSRRWSTSCRPPVPIRIELGSYAPAATRTRPSAC